MSIDEHIAHATDRRDAALINGKLYDVVYWNGYLDGLKAIKQDYNNERN